MTETRDERSEQQAQAQLASIREMVAALECDYDRLHELRDEREGLEEERNWENAQELAELEEAAGESESQEQARERIEEDPLSVQVRSGWYSPGAGEDDRKPEQFEILLCTGGPACRIVGELNEHGEPVRAWIEHQDWGTPWTEYFPDDTGRQALLTYAACFYFGE
jgi:hypothetical protein